MLRARGADLHACRPVGSRAHCALYTARACCLSLPTYALPKLPCLPPCYLSSAVACTYALPSYPEAYLSSPALRPRAMARCVRRRTHDVYWLACGARAWLQAYNACYTCTRR